MYDSADEPEIKVEYFESFETDPLCDSKRKRLAEENLNFTVSNLVSKGTEDGAPEKEVKWYKNINKLGKYVCISCDLSYTTVQTLRNHVRMKHPQNYNEVKNITKNCLRKRKLKCHICKQKYEDIIDLQEHIRSHGIENIQNSCLICHATFEGTNQVFQHITSNHNCLKKKLHFCSICGYTTSKLSHFKQHENTHIDSHKKKCLYCDYSTNYLPNLKIHERIHTEHKPYLCDFEGCGYRCAAKSALYSHQLKHNRENNILYCDKCSYSTVYKVSLKKHIASHSRNSVWKKFLSK